MSQSENACDWEQFFAHTHIPIKPAAWLRPPQLFEIASDGDCRRFMLIAEPKLGQGVYGVSYRIARVVEQHNADVYMTAFVEAARELRRRILAGDKHGEGVSADELDYQITLHRDGGAYEPV